MPCIRAVGANIGGGGGSVIFKGKLKSKIEVFSYFVLVESLMSLRQKM